MASVWLQCAWTPLSLLTLALLEIRNLQTPGGSYSKGILDISKAETQGSWCIWDSTWKCPSKPFIRAVLFCTGWELFYRKHPHSDLNMESSDGVCFNPNGLNHRSWCASPRSTPIKGWTVSLSLCVTRPLSKSFISCLFGYTTNWLKVLMALTLQRKTWNEGFHIGDSQRRRSPDQQCIWS